MYRKLKVLVFVSLVFAAFCKGRVLAEERSLDKTIVTAVDYRYNNQAPVGYFEVQGVDGETHMAFCGWHEKKMPQKGWEMTTLDVYTAENQKNENLRKVLWYGFNGPGNIGANYAQTALAASVALGHMDTDDTGETEGPIGKVFLSQVKDLSAPPSEFQVLCVRNLEETEYQYQCLVYYIYEQKGSLKVIKESANPNLVQDNNNYSLKNAVYGIYSDEACTQKIGEVITGEDGRSEEMNLEAGTYYVKEEKAPLGYRLDATIKECLVTAGNTIEIKFKDEPYFTKVDLILKKYDRELEYSEEINVPQGAASLEGAEYQVDFYEGLYNSLEEVEEKQLLKSWIMRTDAEGMIRFSEEYLVMGDAAWMSVDGEMIMPLGTLVIQEIKAPKGYKINSEKIIKSISKEEIVNGEELLGFVRSPEDVIKGNVIIKKYYMEGQSKVPLEGVIFSFVSKTTGKEYRITTNSNGEAMTADVGGLPYDTYQVKEVNVPDGFKEYPSFEVVISEESSLEKAIVIECENEKIKNEQIENKDIVRTGDESQWILYVVMLMLSVVMILKVHKMRK